MHKLPKGDLPGKGTVTEPNKKPSQPVDVTTPARKTPTLDVKRDPETGDVTVTPKKPDGTTYPPGTKVEIPGKDGKTQSQSQSVKTVKVKYQTVIYQMVKPAVDSR